MGSRIPPGLPVPDPPRMRPATLNPRARATAAPAVRAVATAISRVGLTIKAGVTPIPTLPTPASNAWPDRTQSFGSSNGRSGGSSDSDNWSEGENWSNTSSSSHSETDTETEGIAETESHTVSRVVIEGENESESVGDTIGTSESRSRNWAQTQQEGTSVGVGDTTGTSVGDTKSWSDGLAEALAPILEDRPGSVHSKENVTHMAAEVINHLP